MVTPETEQDARFVGREPVGALEAVEAFVKLLHVPGGGGGIHQAGRCIWVGLAGLCDPRERLDVQALANQPAQVFECANFLRRVFMRPGGADAEGPDDFPLKTQRHANHAANAAGLGRAVGGDRRIVNFHRLAARCGLAGNTFADGNQADAIQRDGRQAHLRRQPQHLLFLVEPVNRAGLGIETLERRVQNLLRQRVAFAAALEEQFNLLQKINHVFWFSSRASA